MRVHHTASGLSRLGGVDLFVAGSQREDFLAVPGGGPPFDRWTIAAAPSAPWSRDTRLRWLLGDGLPRQCLRRDNDGMRNAYTAWKTERYDVVWLHRIESYAALWGVLTEPVVVDLDDLEDHKLRAWLALGRRGNGRDARGAARHQAGTPPA
jgi:hypothetical protein